LSQRSQLAFLEGNLLLAIMIGQGVPEVKLHLRLARIAIWLSTMRDSASPRIMSRSSMAVIRTTSVMSLKIRGISEIEHHLHRDDP
jgi:hypothetical protein